MKRDNIKLKRVLYFILGLMLNFLGLLIGGLWIKFKSKTNKKTKFHALITGVAVALFFSLVISPYLIAPQLEKMFYSQYPEMQIIKTAVQNKYPDGTVSTQINWHTSYNTGEKTTTMIVGYKFKKLLTGKEMQNMGKLVCTTLSSTGATYDGVGIVSVASSLPIEIPFFYVNKSFSVSATCDEWFHKDFNNAVFPI